MKELNSEYEFAVLDILRGTSIVKIELDGDKWRLVQIARMVVGGWCVAFGQVNEHRYVAAMYDGSILTLEKQGRVLVPSAAGKIMEGVANVVTDGSDSVLLPTLEGAIYQLKFISGRERTILKHTQEAMKVGKALPGLGEQMICADEVEDLLTHAEKDSIIDKVQTSIKIEDGSKVEAREIIGCVGLYCT